MISSQSHIRQKERVTRSKAGGWGATVARCGGRGDVGRCSRRGSMADALCGGEFERERVCGKDGERASERERTGVVGLRVCGKDNERRREGERERESDMGGIQKDKR